MESGVAVLARKIEIAAAPRDWARELIKATSSRLLT